jgi:hypothetical protein
MKNENHYEVQTEGVADFGAPPEDNRTRKSTSVVHRPGVIETVQGPDWPGLSAERAPGPAVRPQPRQS